MISAARGYAAVNDDSDRGYVDAVGSAAAAAAAPIPCLPSFNSTHLTKQAWVLEPGDALYIPPRIAHHGVSLDEVRVSKFVLVQCVILGRGI